MSIEPLDIALALLTVLGAVLLLSVFAVGLAGVRTTGGLSILLVALCAIGFLLVGPYRRVRI